MSPHDAAPHDPRVADAGEHLAGDTWPGAPMALGGGALIRGTVHGVALPEGMVINLSPTATSLRGFRCRLLRGKRAAIVSAVRK